MRILLVSATEPEIAPLRARLRCATDGGDPRVTACTHADRRIDVLTTGVGMVATAAWCSRQLARTRYDLAVNVGVCGSFDPALAPGTVVHVVSDCIAELGAEDGEAFLSAEDLALLGPDEFPFRGGRLVNASPPAIAPAASLPAVRGITVNTVHGRESSIARVVERLAPQVESMEGAAFMYACLIHQVPFLQIRAVSNLVERRNRAAWKLADAIDNLGRAAFAILDHA